jgi:cullin 3
MLAKLKVECGYQFTHKLEGMFNDIRVSSDTTDDYKKHIASMEVSVYPIIPGTNRDECLQSPCIDLSVIVMTSTFWPMNHSISTCLLPQELAQAVKLFERFYLSCHSGRKLTWQPGLGNVDIKAAFKAKKHDINLPTFAAVVLLLFQNVEEGEEKSYEDIKNETQIPDADLQRALQSIACAKFKLLKKIPPSREVHPGDSFTYNVDFSSPLQKIKIGVISTKIESNEERKETRDRIEEERKHQTEVSLPCLSPSSA